MGSFRFTLTHFVCGVYFQIGVELTAFVKPFRAPFVQQYRMIQTALRKDYGAQMDSIQKTVTGQKAYALSIFFTTLAFLSLACGCNLSSIFTGMVGGIEGVGNLVEEVRPIQGVRKVEISNQGDLFIEIGERESLVIKAQENLLPFIRSEVRDGSLRIYTSGTQIIRPTSPIRYYLTLQSLDEIVLSSSGDAQLPQLETEDFTIRITSSGDLTIDGLFAERADVQISSSGNVTIKDGRLREQRIMLSSSEITMPCIFPVKLHARCFLAAGTQGSMLRRVSRRAYPAVVISSTAGTLHSGSTFHHPVMWCGSTIENRGQKKDFPCCRSSSRC